MAWLTDIPTADAGRKTEDFLRLPIGAASPLWFAYAGAAGAGVAYWWMTRWLRPTNLEAFSVSLPSVIPSDLLPAKTQETFSALMPEPVAMEPVVEAAETMAREAQAAADEVEDIIEVSAETIQAATDDLTRLAGVGPTLAAKLGDLGVRTFADIAAWTGEDLDKYDKALDLKGRAVRENWVNQARQFAAQ